MVTLVHVVTGILDAGNSVVKMYKIYSFPFGKTFEMGEKKNKCIM